MSKEFQETVLQKLEWLCGNINADENAKKVAEQEVLIEGLRAEAKSNSKLLAKANEKIEKFRSLLGD